MICSLEDQDLHKARVPGNNCPLERTHARSVEDSFIKDLDTGQILLTSLDGKLDFANSGGANFGISADGQWLLIGSIYHLVPEDTNGSADLDLFLVPNRLFSPAP